MEKLKLATVFSGIGAVEFALKRMNVPYDITFACDNGEREIEYDFQKEWDAIKGLKSIDEKQQYVENLYSQKTRSANYVKQSYLANYTCPENRYFEDVRLLDGTDFKNQVDLFVGGSPCQSFSSVGFQGGLEDTRGTLFYDYARLIKEIQPKAFIYENVRNMLSLDNGADWQIILASLESLGYHLRYAVLDAEYYGIPQRRRRLIVVGLKENVRFSFPPVTKKLSFYLKDLLIDNCPLGNYVCDNKGQIIPRPGKGSVEDYYYLTPLLYKYVMKGGTKTFYQKPIINCPVARTVLKTMGNHHRAGIDNYVSNDGSTDLGKVRILTEREAHRLMGFTDDYKIVVSRSQAYKQAGNSIVVDVLIAVLNEIIKSGIFKEE